MSACRRDSCQQSSMVSFSLSWLLCEGSRVRCCALQQLLRSLSSCSSALAALPRQLPSELYDVDHLSLPAQHHRFPVIAGYLQT